MPRFPPRKGMPSPRLTESEFRRRFLAQFQDPAFDSLSRELDRPLEMAGIVPALELDLLGELGIFTLGYGLDRDFLHLRRQGGPSSA